MAQTKGKYPDTFYRVSLKAIIRNSKGEVLLVQEGDDAWTFPGGGAEHGESDIDTLKRELREEVLFEGDYTSHPIGIEPKFLPKLEAWLLWIVYEVICDDGYTYGISPDTNDVGFKDPHTFKDSTNDWERLIYKWAVEKSPH